jgi:hypothetical protein
MDAVNAARAKWTMARGKATEQGPHPEIAATITT